MRCTIQFGDAPWLGQISGEYNNNNHDKNILKTTKRTTTATVRSSTTASVWQPLSVASRAPSNIRCITIFIPATCYISRSSANFTYIVHVIKLHKHSTTTHRTLSVWNCRIFVHANAVTTLSQFASMRTICDCIDGHANLSAWYRSDYLETQTINDGVQLTITEFIAIDAHKPDKISSHTINMVVIRCTSYLGCSRSHKITVSIFLGCFEHQPHHPQHFCRCL